MQSIRLSIPCIIALFLVFFAGCLPGPAPEPAPSDQTVTDSTVVTQPEPEPLPQTYATRNLRTRSRIRSEATTSSDIVATLDAGTQVGLVGLEHGWYNVRIDTLIGWVWAPLLQLQEQDQWDAAISAAQPNFGVDSLFVAMYRDERVLRIILDIAWRDMSRAQKLRIVNRVGEAWKNACERMRKTPPPEIKFMSNNEVEMARWHGFWGARVHH